MKKRSQRVIHLIDMLKYVFNQWKILLTGCILIGIVFGGLGIYKVHNKYVSNSNEIKRVEINVSGTDLDNVEAVLTLEQAIKSQREYNKNSLLMRIDPNNKKMCSLKYQFHVNDDVNSDLSTSKLEQGKKAYQNVLFDDRLYESINTKLQQNVETKYLRELIYAETDVIGVIVYNITAENEEIALEISGGIQEYLSEHNKEILGNCSGVSATVDSEVISTMVDLGLQGTQTNYHANLQNLTTTLDTRLIAMSDNAKQYLELARSATADGNYELGQPLCKEVSTNGNISTLRKLYEAILYAVKRLVLFIGLFLAFCSIKYIWSKKLMCADDIQSMYGVRIIDTIDSKDKERIGIVAEKIALLVGEDKELIVVSCNKSNISFIDVQIINDYLKPHDIVIKNCIFWNSIEAIKEFQDIKDVIIVEFIGKSLYDELDEEINALMSLRINVIGAVVLNNL